MESFAVESPAFQGPLDVLLALIEERKMSISDVSLAEVTDAYLTHVEKLPALPLGETAQFVLVASTLLLIKSRALLPSMELSPDERESVEELERRLARLRIIRQCSKMLRRQWGRAPLLLARRAPARPAVFAPSEASRGSVREAVARLLSVLPKPSSLAEATVAPLLPLEEVILQLKERLGRAFRARFSDLTRSRGRQDVIVFFLATLELVRSGSASATQEKLFEDITIELDELAAPRYGV